MNTSTLHLARIHSRNYIPIIYACADWFYQGNLGATSITSDKRILSAGSVNGEAEIIMMQSFMDSDYDSTDRPLNLFQLIYIRASQLRLGLAMINWHYERHALICAQWIIDVKVQRRRDIVGIPECINIRGEHSSIANYIARTPMTSTFAFIVGSLTVGDPERHC